MGHNKWFIQEKIMPTISVDGPETVAHLFYREYLNFDFFDQPEFARLPMGLGETELLEVVEYLNTKCLPDFQARREDLSFKFGGQEGCNEIMYQVVLVTYPGGKFVYLFRMKAILPEDENWEKFGNKGRYKWRTCGFAERWPIYYHRVTWTNT